ncbi:MAG: prolyl oligopeptidase family serine peptidase [Clostridia bacterium]|nr:prolyl oligopeptidase family serine peptidase [Clostridia bacterium]
MKTKNSRHFYLQVIMLTGIFSVGVFASYTDLDEAKAEFRVGVGPETDGYAIDYIYYSPADKGDRTKYPLVIWLHGMGNGKKPGEQLVASDIAVWATPEYQSRFKGSKGAYILVPRSLEEKNLFWDDCLVHPLRAAIDEFIAENRANIDLSRIYIGGYSMGGKMTLKMAVAYPEMFAAAFPVCPAWAPDTSATAKMADIPVWECSISLRLLSASLKIFLRSCSSNKKAKSFFVTFFTKKVTSDRRGR